MNILLCCAAGMSSSLMVQRMREAVRAMGREDIKIGGCARVQLERYLDEADLVFIAPQLDFLQAEQERLSAAHHVRILRITYEEYSNMDGEALLKRALSGTEIVSQAPPKKIVTVLSRLAYKVSLSPVLNAISQSFSALMPVTLIGSLFTLLARLPFIPSAVVSLLTLGEETTIGFISLYLVFFFAYYYVKRHNIDGHGAGLLALVSFMILTGRVNGRYETTYLGTAGMFGAMVTGIATGWIYVWCHRHHLVRLVVPRRAQNILADLFPGLLIISLAVSVHALILKLGFINFHDMIYTGVQSRLSTFISNNIYSYVFFLMLSNLLWFFGIHGGNTVWTLTSPLYVALALENFNRYQAGLAPQNIISSAFMKTYTSGGVGSMLSLALIMCFFAKSKRFKTLGRLALPLTVFFINEPLVFGLPVILNPLFFVPLMFITPLLAVLTYIMMAVRILPVPNGMQVPWTTPPVVYGFLQGSWKLAVWEVLMIFLAGLMWYPFFKTADRKAHEEEKEL